MPPSESLTSEPTGAESAGAAAISATPWSITLLYELAAGTRGSSASPTAGDGSAVVAADAPEPGGVSA